MDFGLMGVISFLLSHWEDTKTVLEEYLPLIGAVMDETFKAELQDATNAGQVTYQELTETLESRLSDILTIEWPGNTPEQDDIVEVLPDHIYVTFPGTEIVIVDLINAKAWFEDIPWDDIGGLYFKILDTAYEASPFAMLFNILGTGRVPWTHKLKYRDSVSGVVDVGDQFEPEKNIKWNEVEDLMIKVFTLAMILWGAKHFGIYGKVWNVIKIGRNSRQKKMIRSALSTIQSDHDEVTAALTTIASNISDVSDLNDEQITILQSIVNTLGLRLNL